MKKVAWIACTVLLTGLAGCESTTGRYLEDRGRDLMDVIPISVSTGLGAYLGGRATEFAGTGFGWAETERLGWVRRKQIEGEPLESALGGYLEWPETVWGAGLVWERTDDPPPGAGNWGFFVPIRNLPAPRWTYDPGSALDIEADAHLGILGMRIAVSPVQFVDFLVSFSNYDLLNDDMNRIEDASGQ